MKELEQDLNTVYPGSILNTFQHKVKEYFLYKIRQKDNNVYLYD